MINTKQKSYDFSRKCQVFVSGHNVLNTCVWIEQVLCTSLISLLPHIILFSFSIEQHYCNRKFTSEAHDIGTCLFLSSVR